MDVSEYLESEYLTVEYVKKSSSRIGTILSAGLPAVGLDGVNKKIKVVIDIGGKQKFWMINKPSLKNLSAKWGLTSESYVGKQVIFGFAVLQGGREALVASPVETQQ